MVNGNGANITTTSTGKQLKDFEALKAANVATVENRTGQALAEESEEGG